MSGPPRDDDRSGFPGDPAPSDSVTGEPPLERTDGGDVTARSRTPTERDGSTVAGTGPDGHGATGGWRGVVASASLSLLDRVWYALFARHADGDGHARTRKHYRAANVPVDFELYIARVYGWSWVVALLAAGLTVAAVLSVDPGVRRGVFDGVAAVLPRVETLPTVGAPPLSALGAVVVGAGTKRAAVVLGGLRLRWRAAARRANIERTLPGAVRYLHVLSTGSDGRRAMLRKVASTSAYGETATAFRRALNAAATTGNLAVGLRRVARDTPSRNVLAPFLLKFREHAEQGEDALRNYLRMESRMLGQRQDRARKRAEGFLELLAELFIVLLVLPALLVIILTVMAVIAPGLSAPVTTPIGSTTVRGLIVYASAGFVLAVGLGASTLVAGLRPADQTISYTRPSGRLDTLLTAASNPASAAVVAAAPAVLVVAVALSDGTRVVDAALAGYVAYGVPVGLVAVRRARLDDAKDREIADFVHAVSGHVTLGRPFPEAVRLVARDVDLGPLSSDVADLALNLSLTSPASGSDDSLRTAALDEFVENVGTPLAAQSIGLVTGALEGGSDAGTVFETLQAEIGRLYHEKRTLRAGLLVYVAVGWTTALLVVGITAAVSAHVFDGFAQLSSVSSSASFVLDPAAVDLERDRYRIYVVTQATMLASGVFAGTASRGRYEALLHSGLLVVVCYAVFTGVGLL